MTPAQLKKFIETLQDLGVRTYKGPDLDGEPVELILDKVWTVPKGPRPVARIESDEIASSLAQVEPDEPDENDIIDGTPTVGAEQRRKISDRLTYGSSI